MLESLGHDVSLPHGFPARQSGPPAPTGLPVQPGPAVLWSDPDRIGPPAPHRAENLTFSEPRQQSDEGTPPPAQFPGHRVFTVAFTHVTTTDGRTACKGEQQHIQPIRRATVLKVLARRLFPDDPRGAARIRPQETYAFPRGVDGQRINALITLADDERDLPCNRDIRDARIMLGRSESVQHSLRELRVPFTRSDYFLHLSVWDHQTARRGCPAPHALEVRVPDGTSDQFVISLAKEIATAERAATPLHSSLPCISEDAWQIFEPPNQEHYVFAHIKFYDANSRIRVRSGTIDGSLLSEHMGSMQDPETKTLIALERYNG